MSLLGSIADVLGGMALDYGGKQANAAVNSKRGWKYYQKQAALDWHYNRMAAELNYGYNSRMAQENYSRMLDAWNLENEYNTPLSQMSRLRAAGLNPYLMYSDGKAGYVSSMPTVPEGDSVDVGSPNANFSPIGGSGLDLRVLSDLKTQEAQRGLIDSQAGYYDALARKTNTDVDVVIPTQVDLMKSQRDVNEATSANLRSRTIGQDINNYVTSATADINIKQQEKQFEIMCTKLEQYAVELEQSKLDYKFSRNTFDAREDIIQKDLKLKSLAIIAKGVEISAMEADIELTLAETDKITQDYWNAVETGSILELQKDAQEMLNEQTESDLKWFVRSKVGRTITNTLRTIGSLLNPAAAITSSAISAGATKEAAATSAAARKVVTKGR